MKLFFCSQRNHIRIFSKFAKEYGLENVKFILLYTTGNIDALYGMKEEITDSEFYDAIELQLPLTPLQFNLWNIYKLTNIYSDLFNRHDVESIYVVSYERHYSLLCNIAAKKSIQTNLVEEGTGTYKYLVDDYKNGHHNQTFSLIDFIYLKLWKVLFVGDHPLLQKSLLLLKALLLSIPYIFMHENIQIRAYRTIPFLKQESDAFLNSNFQFNKTYTSFPELTKKIFTSDSFEKFFPQKIDDPFNTNTIRKGSYLFVSQPYRIKKEVYYPAIINILEKIAYADNIDIYIKLHPRESSDLRSYTTQHLLTLKNSKVHLLTCQSRTSVESMLASGLFNTLLGITSTALIYSKIVNPNVSVISIADELLFDLSEDPLSKKNVLTEISSHYKIMKLFSHITHYQREI